MNLAKPPFDWATVRSCFDDPLYDDAAVLALFADVGRPDSHGDWVEPVRTVLHQLTAGFAFDLWEETQPAATTEGAMAEGLAEACRRVLAIVGSGEAEPSPDNIHPFFGSGGLYAAAAFRVGPQGRQAVMNQLRAVYALKRDAETMARIAERQHALHPQPEGRPESQAKKKLVAGLAKLYAGVWKREAGVSLTPPGPFVRLMLNVAGALHERLGRHSFSYTAEALAHIWRRLPEDEKGKLPTLPDSWRA